MRRTKKEDEREEREYFLPVSRDPLTMILLLVQRKTDCEGNPRPLMKMTKKANERGKRGEFKQKEKLGRLV